MTTSKVSIIAGRLLIVLLIVAAGAGGWWWFSRPKPVSVVFAEVGTGKVESSIANTRAGAVESCQRTKLSTLMGGRIDQLPVKEGDRVKKGQLLMKLWNDDQMAPPTPPPMTPMPPSVRRSASICCMPRAMFPVRVAMPPMPKPPPDEPAVMRPRRVWRRLRLR